MSDAEAIVYLNGAFLPMREAKIPSSTAASSS